jgi:hypothetical protein
MTNEEYEKIREICKPHYYNINTNPLIDRMHWATYREELGENIVIKQENIGNYEVSTVYVGLDMGLFNPLPLIFETMIFCDDADDPLYLWQERYTYKDQALEGHERAVILASGIKNDR